jgi:hypothetical protein
MSALKDKIPSHQSRHLTLDVLEGLPELLIAQGCLPPPWRLTVQLRSSPGLGLGSAPSHLPPLAWLGSS